MKVIREKFQNEFKTKSFRSRMLKTAVVLFTACILAVSALSGCSQNNKNNADSMTDIAKKDGQTENGVLYIKKDGLYEHRFSNNTNNLLYRTYNFNKMDTNGSAAQYSQDGKYLYYLERSNSGNTLKVMEPGKEGKKSDKAESNNKDQEDNSRENNVIASDVEDFRILKGGEILYKKSSEGGLYIYRDNDSDKISGYVEEYFLNKDEDFMLFYTTDSDIYKEKSYYNSIVADIEQCETGTLYYYDIKNNEKGREKIQDGILTGSIKYSQDFKIVYYIKKEEDKQVLYCIRGFKESADNKVEPELIAQGNTINSVYLDSETGELYYQIEEKDDRLYDLFIDDDMTTDIEDPAKPQISEEDKKNMFETKKVISDKELKEYALLNMEEEFRKALKEKFKMFHFGALFYYNAGESKKLSDNAYIYTLKYEPVENTIKNNTVFFDEIDVNNIEKIKLSEAFSDYLNCLNKKMNYSSDDEHKKTDKEDNNTAKELDIDKLIYEYYHERQSPLGEYFYYKKTDKKDKEEALEEERRKHGTSSDYGDDNSLYEYGKDEYGSLYDDIYDYDSYDYDSDGYGWSYSDNSDDIAEEFFYVLGIIRGKAFNTSFVSGDEVYSFNMDNDYITDACVDNENKKVYFMRFSDEKIKMLKELSTFNDYFYKMESEGLDYKKIYLTNKELCKAELSESKIDNFEVMDNEVSSISGVYGGKIYYMKDELNNDYDYSFNGTLYCDGKKIRPDIDNIIVNDGTIYLQTESDRGINATYSLYKLDADNKAEKIAADVYDHKILSDKSVVYVNNYNKNRNKGDLKLWKDKDHDELLDKDVVSLIGGERDYYYDFRDFY